MGGRDILMKFFEDGAPLGVLWLQKLVPWEGFRVGPVFPCWGATLLENEGDLVDLVIPLEERRLDEELDHNASMKRRKRESWSPNEERKKEKKEEKENQPDTPHINFRPIIDSTKQEFWRAVPESDDPVGVHLALRVDGEHPRQTKISQLENPLVVNKEVRR